MLLPEHLEELQEIFSDPTKTWYFHNAKYDLHILRNAGIEVAGTVHCTQSGARIEWNQHLTYNLADCGQRIGQEKDEAVEKCIADEKLWDWLVIPGKKARKKDKHFDRVPFPIISHYALRDAEVCAHLGHTQEKTFKAWDRQLESAPHVPRIAHLVANERELTKVVFEIERVGVKVDLAYCSKAAKYEAFRAEQAAAEFQKLVGVPFKDSGKLFAEVFFSERVLWEFTDKRNPSFESDTLSKFKNPAAAQILIHRDARSKANFYTSFNYYADRGGIVHPNLQPDGTATGRFSSSEPNFQNLTSEDGEEDLAKEFVVRRALVPRPGFIFIMPDYEQMEYKMMFDYACDTVGHETEIVKRIKQGFDPHQATADAVTAGGTPLTRSRAKNGNFAFLYGSGIATLAATIGSSLDEAAALKRAISRGAPEVQEFIDDVQATAACRGFIINWAGRRSHFPDPRWAYKAPNYLIQGGCADVMKFAMVGLHLDLLARGAKSRMVLTVHDELLVEVHESELAWVPQLVKEHMEKVFPWKYLPLTTSMEWSAKSFADKMKGFPV